MQGDPSHARDDKRRENPMKNFYLKSQEFLTENPFLAFFILVAISLRLFFWAYTDRTWEDALITLIPAKNVWLGNGLTHHLSEARVHSFTSPLSVLVPLLGEAVHKGLFLLKLTSVLASAGSIYYAYRIGLLLKFHWSAQILLLSYLATDQLQIFFGMTGMETQLATAIFLGNAYYFLNKKWLLVGIFSGLGMLARPEFIIWVAIIGFFILIWYTPKILVALTSFLCVTIPWYLFVYVYYGSIVPNTIIAKSIGYNRTPFGSSFSEVVEYSKVSWKSFAPFKEWFFTQSLPIPSYFSAVTVGIVLSLFALGIIKAYRVRNWQLIFISLVIIMFFIYRLVTIVGTYSMWYLPPFVALLFLIAAYGLSTIAKHHIYLASILSCFTALMYSMHIPFSFPLEKLVQEKIECDVRFKTGKILNTLMGASDTVTLEPLGYIGYAALNKTTYDYPGLSSKIVVNQWKLIRERNLISLIVQLQPSFLVLRPKEINKLLRLYPTVAKNYREVVHIQAQKDLVLKKWGYEDNNLTIDGDYKIFQRISPLTELGPQKTISSIPETYGNCILN